MIDNKTIVKPKKNTTTENQTVKKQIVNVNGHYILVRV